MKCYKGVEFIYMEFVHDSCLKNKFLSINGRSRVLESNRRLSAEKRQKGENRSVISIRALPDVTRCFVLLCSFNKCLTVKSFHECKVTITKV